MRPVLSTDSFIHAHPHPIHPRLHLCSRALPRIPRSCLSWAGWSHCCAPHRSSYRWQGHGRHRREGQGEEVSGLQVAAQVVLAVRVIVLLSFGRSARKLLAHVGAAARGGFGASRPASFFFWGGLLFTPTNEFGLNERPTPFETEIESMSQSDNNERSGARQ